MKAAFTISAFALSACLSSGQTIVPVNPADHGEGLTTVVRDEPRTLQMVIGASLLTDIPEGNSITSLSFRLTDEAADSWPEETLSWANYDIQLSSSLNDPGSLSTDFEENIGSDVLMVRSGPLDIPTASFTSGGSPNAFGYEIVFTNPYLYTGGDLLITIRHSGNGVASQSMEATSVTGDYQVLVGEGYDATEGEDAGVMLVTRLSYGLVPEPSAALLSMGGIVLFAFRRGNRSSIRG